MNKKGEEHVKKGLRIIGVFLLALGIMLSLSPKQGVTGYVVSEEVETNPFTFFGIASIIAGLLIFIIGIERGKKHEDIKTIIAEGLKDNPI